MSIEELIAEVKAKGYQSFVLSDINDTSAILVAKPERDLVDAVVKF